MIKLDTFCLEKLDIEGKHYGLVQGMSLDKRIQLYIARDFFKWLEEHQAISDDKIEVGKMYAIIKENREIGIVGSTEIDCNGVLNVVYAVKKNVRDRGYGKKILEEITTYYLNNIDGIKGIKLVIDESNKGSKKIAEVNGYVKQSNNTDEMVSEWYYPMDDGKRIRK